MSLKPAFTTAAPSPAPRKDLSAVTVSFSYCGNASSPCRITTSGSALLAKARSWSGVLAWTSLPPAPPVVQARPWAATPAKPSGASVQDAPAKDPPSARLTGRQASANPSAPPVPVAFNPP